MAGSRFSHDVKGRECQRAENTMTAASVGKAQQDTSCRQLAHTGSFCDSLRSSCPVQQECPFNRSSMHGGMQTPCIGMSCALAHAQSSFHRQINMLTAIGLRWHQAFCHVDRLLSHRARYMGGCPHVCICKHLAACSWACVPITAVCSPLARQLSSSSVCTTQIGSHTGVLMQPNEYATTRGSQGLSTRIWGMQR